MANVLNNGTTLSAYDYILFVFVFISSTLTGIYFCCFGNRKFSTNEYLMGNGRMKVFPTTLSLIASFLSSVGIVTIPADIYLFGASYIWDSFSVIIAIALSFYVFLPVFFGLKTVSIYEYLEKRYDTKTKVLGSFLFVLNGLLFLPIVIYVTSLTITACSTDLNMHLILWISCGICTFYTAIGGFKTVVWTDTFQCAFIFGGTIAVVILGFYTVGSFETFWSKIVESGRIDIFNFSPDPTERDSFWAIIIGNTFGQMSYASINQVCLQRLLATRKIKDARRSLIYYGIGVVLTKTAYILIGLLMYATYYGCDPVLSNRLSRRDQTLLYFVMDIARNIPGFTGLFLACICSSGLSTLSTYLNCIAGCIYGDFLSKTLKKNISKKYVTSTLLKSIVVIVGILCASFAYIIDSFENIFPLVLSTQSLALGPKLSLFILGMLFPTVNAKGAFYGSILGIISTSCIIFPTKYYQIRGSFRYITKTLSTENCTVDYGNITQYTISPLKNYVGLALNDTVKFKNVTSTSDVPFIFRISFYYGPFIGTAFCMVWSLAISYITNKNQPLVDKTLISPVSHFLLTKEAKEDDGSEYNDVGTALEKLSDD